MELIFEIINPSGRVLERQKINGDKISVGRAFDNQVILSDEFIDPHHVVIEQDQYGQILITDLSSTNGIRDKSDLIVKSKVIESGNEFVLGKTHIRIFAIEHVVPDAMVLDGVDWAIKYFSKNWITAGLFIGMSLLAMVGVWNSDVGEHEARDYIETIFAVIVVALSMALMWGLVGRIVKHEMFFKVQLSIITIYISLILCFEFIYEVILFNSMNYLASISMNTIVEVLLLVTLFWFNMKVATNQENMHRWVIALMLSIGLVSFSIFTEVSERTSFSVNPYFISEMKPPLFRINAGTNLDEFLQEGETIYAHKLE